MGVSSSKSLTHQYSTVSTLNLSQIWKEEEVCLFYGILVQLMHINAVQDHAPYHLPPRMFQSKLFFCKENSENSVHTRRFGGLDFVTIQLKKKKGKERLKGQFFFKDSINRR